MVVSCNFYLLRPAIFAANQLVSEMEIITFESKAYKELDNKITAIADYIFNHTEAESTNEDEIWVDSYEVCTFLKSVTGHYNACGQPGQSLIPISRDIISTRLEK